MMNSASLSDMTARINAQASSRKKKTPSSVGDLSRFRPNFLVGGTRVAAYAEDEWQKVCIGRHDFFTAGETLPWYNVLQGNTLGTPGRCETYRHCILYLLCLYMCHMQHVCMHK